MADITDLIRALNAPPSLGDFSAARTQPWMNGSIGMGPGAQLIMKDPAGVEAAANRWTRARSEISPYAGVIWGDTIGGAQNTVLNERARQVQIAMQREQMAAQAARENRLTRQAEMEQATRRQIGQQQYLARLAESAARARGTNAQALENASRLRQLEQFGGQLAEERSGAETDLADLQRFLRGNADQAVAGDDNLAVRVSADGLPEIYSPTGRAGANSIRDAEARTFRTLPVGVYGPSESDPRMDYEDILTQLSALDSGQRNLARDYGSARNRPTALVDTSIFDELLGGGGAPTIGQSAAQILAEAQARGNAYRLPQGTMVARDLGPIRRSTYRRGDPPVRGLRADAQPRWTFDLATQQVI